MEEHKLVNCWTLWQHDPYNSNWDISSYNILYHITDLHQFWTIYNLMNIECLKYNMLFLMKQDIEPLWESESNINGGYISIKVVNKSIYDIWLELSMGLIGEYIFINKTNIENINGISISPKKGFCILKIWLKSSIDTIDYNPNLNIDFKTAIFKPYNTNYNLKT